ncbi:MAG: hypothetical protein QOI38_3050 [Sphingomonadales bacterium]|jgi:hypothetical protein|nr:hypothetical protein [Sphingomonadales bacterium]
MDAGTFIIRLRDGSLTAPEIISRLPWLAARTLTEFAELADLPSPRFGAVDDPLARHASTSFHQRAGTLTPALEGSINGIAAGRVVKLVHQPNLFAYTKLIGQFAAAALLSERLHGATPVFGFIDYDVVSNERFRRALLPDVTGAKGTVRIQLPAAAMKHRTQIASRSPPPDHEWAVRVGQEVSRIVGGYRKAGVQVIGEDIEAELCRDLVMATERAANLADCCAILLSRFINGRLGLDIPFVPMSVLWEAAATDHAHLACDPAVGRALKSARLLLASYGVEVVSRDSPGLPWWGICMCGSRAALNVDGSFTNPCSHCGRSEGVVSQRSKAESIQSSAPTILLHNLLNMSGFGFGAGVSHLGSADHILLHSLAMSLAGLNPLPQWLWRCDGPFHSTLEAHHVEIHRESIRLVLSGDAGFPFLDACLGPTGVMAAIRSKVF